MVNKSYAYGMFCHYIITYQSTINLPYDELAEGKPDASAIHDKKVLVASSKKFFLSMTEEDILQILENP